MDSLGNSQTIAFEPPPSAVVEILDYLGPARFISKRAFKKDMHFHIRQCKPVDMHEFMHTFFFDDYIEETYGHFFNSMHIDILKNELGLDDGLEVDPIFIIDE